MAGKATHPSMTVERQKGLLIALPRRACHAFGSGVGNPYAIWHPIIAPFERIPKSSQLALGLTSKGEIT